MSEIDGDTVADCPHEDAVKWNPYNRVVQCHKCGQIFVPELAATPGDAVMGFAAWLTSRHQSSGPFARHLEATEIVELVKTFCEFNKWEVGPNFPHTFKMPSEGGM